MSVAYQVRALIQQHPIDLLPRFYLEEDVGGHIFTYATHI